MIDGEDIKQTAAPVDSRWPIPVIVLKCRRPDDPADEYWDVHVRCGNDLRWICFANNLQSPAILKLIRMIVNIPDYVRNEQIELIFLYYDRITA